MKFHIHLAAIAFLAGCVGAPVTQTTQTACANIAAARAAEDIAISLAKRQPTEEEMAALRASRAQVDARCAQVK